MIKEQIEKLIIEALAKIGATNVNFDVEHPTDLSHGDYSTNVAMVLAKDTGKKPAEIAQEIVKVLSNSSPEEIEKVEIAGPGFINFTLSKRFFSNSLKNILSEGENFGKNKSLSGKKVIVEYTDPNPFKEFHIGHLMSNTIGESISRLIEWSGAETKHACYQGDVGMHVAKAIWGKMNPPAGGPNLTWGEAYALGSRAYEENKEEIVDLNKKIYERSDEKINELYDQGKKESLEYFDEIYKKLGTHFDYFFFESESAEYGKKLVEENTGRIFEESEGAIVFRGENYDKSLHTRVFVNKEGLPTYEAKELGLAKIKHDKYPYDLSVVITGNEVNEYFRVLLAAMKQIFPDLAEKTHHLSHGMLRLPGGKMSSRTGDVITAESLIEEVKNQIAGKAFANVRDMSPEKMEQVAVGAIKYSILRQAPGKDIIFDIEKSISLEGDSGPYLQYTRARINSVLEKASSLSIQAVPNEEAAIFPIEKILYRFPEVVERAQEDFAPHHVLTYLVQVAGEFNSFYAMNVIAEPSDPLSSHKCAIASAVHTILQNGLLLLGIPSPDKM